MYFRQEKCKTISPHLPTFRLSICNITKFSLSLIINTSACINPINKFEYIPNMCCKLGTQFYNKLLLLGFRLTRTVNGQTITSGQQSSGQRCCLFVWNETVIVIKNPHPALEFQLFFLVHSSNLFNVTYFLVLVLHIRVHTVKLIVLLKTIDGQADMKRIKSGNRFDNQCFLITVVQVQRMTMVKTRLPKLTERKRDDKPTTCERGKLCSV